MNTSLVLFLVAVSVSGHAQVIASMQSNGYAHEAIVVSPNEFGFRTLQALARDFMRRHENAVFGKFEVGTGPGIRFYGSKGSTHVTVENYFYRLHRVYPDGVDAYGNIATLLKCGRSAVLRVRQDGKVFQFDIGDTVLPGSAKGLELLHLTPTFEGNSVVGIEVFIRSKPLLSQQRAEAITYQLWRLQSKFKIRLFARSDAWFITNPAFPFIYAFDTPVIVPTLEAYKQTSEVMAVYPKH